MTETLLERYQSFIEDLIQQTLQGKFRSKEQIGQTLMTGIQTGSGEVFERCLAARSQSLAATIASEPDELKQARAIRSQRAIKMIQSAWEQVQQHFQTTREIDTALKSLLEVEDIDILSPFLTVLDPNREGAMNRDQLQQLAAVLQTQGPSHPEVEQYDITRLGIGLSQALKSWATLEPDLLTWVYESAQGSIGFGGGPGSTGPWASWAKRIESTFAKEGLNTLALQKSLLDWLTHRAAVPLDEWIEFGLLLQWIQRGLIGWFDKQAYDPKSGPKLSISVYLTFTVIWYELARGYQQATFLNPLSRQRYEIACFQISLQILRTFTRQPYFPLYGGVFAAFSGGYLKMTLDYLDIPLKWVEGTQEKARILTLLGASQGALGQLDQAMIFNTQALELARTAGDSACEIANLNHLSRIAIAQNNYSEAIDQSQRALLLSRQKGDRPGQANALANLGYSQVLQAQQREYPDADQYELALGYLQQGLKLAEQDGDRQSEALCCISLGIAYSVQEDYLVAIEFLRRGVEVSVFLGDIALRGQAFSHLAEAYYALNELEKAVCFGGLSMYLLHQINGAQWRHGAGLLSIIQGKLGAEKFKEILEAYRRQLQAEIGSDGVDYIPELLNQYRQSD